jgi:hypothetical protein
MPHRFAPIDRATTKRSTKLVALNDLGNPKGKSKHSAKLIILSVQSITYLGVFEIADRKARDPLEHANHSSMFFKGSRAARACRLAICGDRRVERAASKPRILIMSEPLMENP